MNTEIAVDQHIAKQTTRFLDTVLDTAAASVVIADAVGTVEFASTGIERLLGHPRAALVGRSMFDYLHPDDIDLAVDMVAKRLRGEEPAFGFTLRLRNAAGGWTPARLLTNPLPDNPIGAMVLAVRSAEAVSSGTGQALRRQLLVEGFCNRLTGQFMEAERASDMIDLLERSLAQVGDLSRADGVGVFMERRESGRLEAIARWSDPTIDRSSAQGSFDLHAHPVLERLLAEPCRVDDIGDGNHPELQQLLGRTEIASLMTVPIRNGGQRGLFALSRVVAAEWTESEGVLARNLGRLFGRALANERTDELLALSYEQGPVGFSIRTWDGTLVDCNDAYLKLYGIDREDAGDAHLDRLVHPTDRELIRARVEQLRRGEVDRIEETIRIIKWNGEVRWMSAIGVQISGRGAAEPLLLSALDDITETKAQREKLAWDASHDALTGAANRDAMVARIRELAAESGTMPNLFLIDLDRFKLVNDSLGHLAGDAVLTAVVQRIRENIRGRDMVARLGGDEFAVVVPAMDGSDVTAFAERLRRSLDRPLDIDGRPTVQTISVGVALGAEASDVDDLLARGDRAMYAAKAKGRNRHVVFDTSLRDEVLESVSLTRELRQAVDRDEFDVYFQPEFRLADRTIVGGEALLRWRHPERGLLAAGAFIDVAEQSGIIDDIGRVALRKACSTFGALAAATGARDLSLRVNVSGREWSRPELTDLVRAALEDSALPPGLLCLEMTETTLMDAPDLVADTFHRLKALGVEFAIDDFGTGYSSLAYLKRYPVHALKIDRSFVADVTEDADSRAIVESIVGLSHAMDLDVVAEGVETEDQAATLLELGCTRGQGYLVAPALPAEEFAALLAG